MRGDKVREKIRAKGYTYHAIAQAIGESDQNLRSMLSVADVKSGTLERIAAAMGENVAYFYNEQPIFTLVEYVEYESCKKENTMLRQIIEDKNRIIELLSEKQI